MKQIIFLMCCTFLLLTSCGSANNKGEETSQADTEPQQGIVANDNERIVTALTFANTYIERGGASMNEMDEWVESNSMTTESFKSEYKKIINKAWEEDPEMGLGFDPIINGQDFPDEGYELDNVDSENGYVFLIGKGEGYRLTVKIVKEGDKWLVDGAGIINIPSHDLE